jgi:hypothetical protein
MIAAQHPALFFWGLAFVQLLGLTSACTARLSEGSRRQRPFQRLFFACLVLIGAVTIVTLGFGWGCWLLCGTTLSVMVLTVTWDLRPAVRPGVLEF